MSTPLTKQQIIDQTSIELAEKICENMKGSKDFEQSILTKYLLKFINSFIA